MAESDRDKKRMGVLVEVPNKLTRYGYSMLLKRTQLIYTTRFSRYFYELCFARCKVKEYSEALRVTHTGGIESCF